METRRRSPRNKFGPKTYVIGDSVIVDIDMPKTPRRHRTKDYQKFGADSPQWTIGRRDFKEIPSLTNNCELHNNRTFPVLKHKIISDQSHGLFYEPTEGCDKIYDIEPLPFDKGTHIGTRYKAKKPSATPGPGFYNPIYSRETVKLATLSRSKCPDIWEGMPGLTTPGPGSYNVGPQIRKPVRWYASRRVTAPPVDDIIR